MKMPAGVPPETRRTLEWSSETVWLEHLGRYDPSGMIDLLFQHPAVNINSPQWLGQIQKGQRGVDVILAILRHRGLDINTFLARAMTEGNQKYDARFLLWHPPFSMTIAAHPHLDVNAALRTAQECGQWDVAETLLQSLSRSGTLLPEPRGGGDDDLDRLARELVEECVERFREEHTSGPAQREFIFYDRRTDLAR
ncbi:hypothetical protein FA13DRAFT_1729960 [Coprinellus micaceus]|uniref:Uncharacterized protein n=1 Tax=Coprinellus micaceus TaxID=71717 RepID=A0A4Y7THP9_COPMI|nr:hypothetical protein FA13DRAFT_1729960 [Coprinellus micaceus]